MIYFLSRLTGNVMLTTNSRIMETEWDLALDYGNSIEPLLANASTHLDSENKEIVFFHQRSPNHQKMGAAACLMILEDAIRLAEWIPYHYAVLPLSGLVIAMDRKNSPRAVRRTLELIDLWKDKIDITLWPDFILPNSERRRKKVRLFVERQVHFAHQCLVHHKRQNRSWC
jgi:hypothetical protein